MCVRVCVCGGGDWRGLPHCISRASSSTGTTATALKLPTVQLFTAPHSVAQLRSKKPRLSLRLSNHDELRSLQGGAQSSEQRQIVANVYINYLGQVV